MLCREYAAPGLAEQGVAVANANVSEQRIEFAQKEIDGPEVAALVGQMGRFAVADLIVVDDRPPGIGKLLERIDIVVGATRPAVSDDQWQLARFEISDHAVPGAVAPVIAESFGGRMCSHSSKLRVMARQEPSDGPSQALFAADGTKPPGAFTASTINRFALSGGAGPQVESLNAPARNGRLVACHHPGGGQGAGFSFGGQVVACDASTPPDSR
ncbi:hypothetical protein BQ8794_50663 [Mesorhizobium prunaredense]|uniref:Uncharacterized protein n=1 Tax=Mesorhizobium prunaredense TaxID=1631249 RepID=A0A1R3VJF6_9HYPH|nr:hypothetical protein BQ8794_50663 [Mesorhizobium prunaredense]